MRRWIILVLPVLSACTAPAAIESDVGADTGAICEGTAQPCAILIGDCCDDAGFFESCRDGEWVCDPCALDEATCARNPPTGLMRNCTRFARDAARMGMSVDAYCGLADGG